MTTITAAAILIASCSDRYAGGILPGAALFVATLIIGGLICH